MSVAALAMASCSKDDSTGINNQGSAIDFRVAMGTRATQMTTPDLEKIFVTAIDKNAANYFTNVEFTKVGQFFTSTPEYHWPSDGSDLSFFAYAPSAQDLGATVEISSTAKTLTDFQPATKIAEQKDFITANATGNKTNTVGVSLVFAHRLAQIEIKAKNTNKNYVYKVTGVRIGQPVSKGTFDFGNFTWALGTDKVKYEVTYTTKKELTDTAASLMETAGDNAMLIPQQLVAWTPDTDKTNANKGAYLSVKVNIATKDGAQIFPTGQNDGWAAVAIDTNWEAGKKYVYTLDFSNGAGVVDPEEPENPGEPILGQPIQFKVEVADWVPAGVDLGM